MNREVGKMNKGNEKDNVLSDFISGLSGLGIIPDELEKKLKHKVEGVEKIIAAKDFPQKSKEAFDEMFKNLFDRDDEDNFSEQPVKQKINVPEVSLDINAHRILSAYFQDELKESQVKLLELEKVNKEGNIAFTKLLTRYENQTEELSDVNADFAAEVQNALRLKITIAELEEKLKESDQNFSEIIQVLEGPGKMFEKQQVIRRIVGLENKSKVQSKKKATTKTQKTK